MSNIFFTADTHFGHENIINYCDRPFDSLAQMNSEMIGRWNVIVKPNDEIYHLGDFAFVNKVDVHKLLETLNGRKHLCIGSHDKGIRQYSKHFEKIAESFEIRIGKQYIFMSHYLHKTWPKSHYNSWHLFGHSHGGMNSYAEKEGKLLDVGVDSHDFYPWKFWEIRDIMNNRPDNFNLVRR